MSEHHEIITITWAVRLDKAKDMADDLNSANYCIYYNFLSGNPWILAPLRYIFQTFKTWQVMLGSHPKVIYVTNPPIFLAMNVYVFCLFAKSVFIIDTHSPALYSKKWGWTLPILRVLARAALVNLVDQERYKVLFESWGAKALVITKKIRLYPKKGLSADLQPPMGRYPITVVNTFAPDEPLLPIIEAAREMPDVQFYILGDTCYADENLMKSSPENITYTGFLLHDAYWNQLYASRAVMTLTTYPYSLVSGGTDGMALGKPLILSQQPALTEYFTKGTVFVENTGESIIEGVRNLQADESRLLVEIRDLVIEKRQSWQTDLQELLDLIEKTQTRLSSINV